MKFWVLRVSKWTLAGLLMSGWAHSQSLEVVPLVDLGDVLPRSKLQTEISLRNIGNSTLNIFDVKTSCTCTVPNFESKEIAPGRSVSLKVTIDVPNGIGNYETQVAVATNDLKKAIREVRIRYNIEPVVRMLPERIATWASANELPKTLNAVIQCTKSGEYLEEVKIESIVPWLKVKNLGIKGNVCPFEIVITNEAPQGIIDLPLKVSVKLLNNDRIFNPRAFVGADIYGLDEAGGARFVHVTSEECNSIVIEVPKWISSSTSARVVGNESTDIRIENELGKWKLSVPVKRDNGNSVCILFADAKGRDVFSLPVYIAPSEKR